MAEEQNKPSKVPVAPIGGGSDRGDHGRARRSRGLRTIQRAENRLTRAARTLAEALEEGLSTYRRKRRKSAERRKDGALLNLVDNFAKGFADAQETAAPASREIITACATKRMKKRLRRTARAAMKAFFPSIY